MKESVANLQFYVNNTTNKKKFIQRSAVLQPMKESVTNLQFYVNNTTNKKNFIQRSAVLHTRYNQ
jgi:oligoribonuclease (3'-5' exoribonuclease)